MKLLIALFVTTLTCVCLSAEANVIGPDFDFWKANALYKSARVPTQAEIEAKDWFSIAAGSNYVGIHSGYWPDGKEIVENEYGKTYVLHTSFWFRNGWEDGLVVYRRTLYADDSVKSNEHGTNGIIDADSVGFTNWYMDGEPTNSCRYTLKCRMLNDNETLLCGRFIASNGCGELNMPESFEAFKRQN